jgi:hypothetical protein
LTAMIPSDLRRQEAHRANLLHAWHRCSAHYKSAWCVTDTTNYAVMLLINHLSFHWLVICILCMTCAKWTYRGETVSKHPCFISKITECIIGELR